MAKTIPARKVHFKQHDLIDKGTHRVSACRQGLLYPNGILILENAGNGTEMLRITDELWKELIITDVWVEAPVEYHEHASRHVSAQVFMDQNFSEMMRRQPIRARPIPRATPLPAA